MGGSDSHTQQNSYYSTANHRHLRVWWPLFYFILNAAITNSYVLYKEHIQKVQKRVKMLSHAEFQEKIALDLLSQPGAVLRRRQLAHSTRRSAPHPNTVQRGSPSRHEWLKTGIRRQCRACKPEQKSAGRPRKVLGELVNGSSVAREQSAKGTSRTEWECTKCRVPICHKSHCWERHLEYSYR
jgi:hypothetical protein